MNGGWNVGTDREGIYKSVDGITRELGKHSAQLQSAGAALKDRLAQLQRMSVSISIPEAGIGARKAALMSLAQTATGERRRRLAPMGAGSMTNAQLLFVQSKSSPLRAPVFLRREQMAGTQTGDGQPERIFAAADRFGNHAEWNRLRFDEE